jgi:hypothetical protein
VGVNWASLPTALGVAFLAVVYADTVLARAVADGQGVTATQVTTRGWGSHAHTLALRASAATSTQHCLTLRALACTQA